MRFLYLCLGVFLVFAKQVCYGAEILPIEKGILDLRNINLEQLGEIEFTGEWEFYWNQLLSPGDFKQDTPENVKFIHIPSVWNSFTIDNKNLPGKGAATYRLLILNNTQQTMALKLGSIGTAFKLFINDSLICSGGKVSLNEENAEPGYNPGVFSFRTPTDTTSIIFQVSNYHYSKGGLWNNFYSLGSQKIVQKKWNRKIQLSLLLIGSMLIFALYHLGLYLINRNFRYTLYFSLFCLVIAIRTLVVNEIFLLDLFPNFNWEALIKTEYITLLAGTITFILFIYKFFNDIFSEKMLRFVLSISIILTLIILSTPAVFFTKYLIVYQINIVIASSYIIYVVIKALRLKRQSAIILLIGFMLLFLAIFNDILYTNKILNTAYLTSFGFILFIFSQGIMLSHRFSSLFAQTETLAHRLEATNQNLERLVTKRTEKIQEQNAILVNQRNEITIKKEALQEQNIEIIAQRDNLQEQNKIVEAQKRQITSSIAYASKIQNAILNHANDIIAVAPEHFILFYPKDIVSGDFYWFKQIHVQGKKLNIATVVDCTGHGVPGAFMSILGALFLNKIVSEFNSNTKASDILNRMREEVKTLLHQNQADKMVKDGMDMALVIIDEEEKKIQYAGAHNPMYVIRNPEGKPANKIEEFGGDKMPIGVYVKEKESFTNHIININSGDLIYLFTDGYYDQFGGENTEKLKKSNFKAILSKNAHLPLKQQKQALKKSLFSWRGNHEQIDDITVIGIKVNL